MNEDSAPKRSVWHALCGAVAGVLVGLLMVGILMMLPVVTVARINLLTDQNWQEWAALIIYFANGGYSLACIFSRGKDRGKAVLLNTDGNDTTESEQSQHLKRSWLARALMQHSWLFSLLFVFLFCESTALCMRLHICMIDQFGANVEQIVRTIGVLVIAAAACVQVAAIHSSFIANENEKFALKRAVLKLRHPVLFGWLLFFIGFPLAFGVWMPVVALPGCYIGLRSWINRQEEVLKEAVGEKYISFQQGTRKIVPFGRFG